MGVFEGPRGGAKNVMPGTWPKINIKDIKTMSIILHARGAERRGKKRIAGDLAQKIVSITIKQKMNEHRKQH